MAVQTDDGFLLSKVEAILPWLSQARRFGKDIHDITNELEDLLRGGGT